MEDEGIEAAANEGFIEVVENGGLSLPQDLAESALLTDGMLAGQQFIILTSSEDGKITGIQAIPQAVQSLEEDSAGPASKRIKVQNEDGQTFVVALTGTTDDVAISQAGLNIEDQHVQIQDPDPTTQTDCALPAELCPEAKSNVVSQEWFTTKDDKHALQSQGHSWKQGQWSREEVDLLQHNINMYCKDRNIVDPTEIIFEKSKDERKDFYRTIARGLQRPLFSVYRRVIRMYDQCNHIGRYSPEELHKLQDLRSKHGPDWATIGAALGRSASSVKDRCRLMKDTCNSGKWLPEEERRLSSAVYELSGCKPGDNVTSGLSWSVVAERVGTRSEKQCRTKWLNYLNWKQKGGTEWTREDDIALVNRIATCGATDETSIDWVELAKDWPSVRSPQWLRGKWWSMKRHVPEYQIHTFPSIVDYLKTMHSQNYRIKQQVTSSVRLRGSEVQQVGVLPNMTVSVPVSITESGDGQSMSVSSDEMSNESQTYQAYEVLQSVGENPTPQGAFLITQPQNNPAISFHTGAMGTDHIIVHTLPINQGNENVAVQMNPSPQVIISATGEEGVTALQAGNVATLQLPDTDNGLQLADDGQIEAAGMTAELVSSDSISQTEIITSDDHTFEAEAITAEDIGTEVTEADLDGSEVVTADLVMAPAPSPQFVQASSSETDLIHMSSLTDPMLTSESADLIGCSSDGEGDKSHAHDTDGDTESSLQDS